MPPPCPSSTGLAYPHTLPTPPSFPSVGCANRVRGLPLRHCSVSGPHGGGQHPWTGVGGRGCCTGVLLLMPGADPTGAPGTVAHVPGCARWHNTMACATPRRVPGSHVAPDPAPSPTHTRADTACPLCTAAARTPTGRTIGPRLSRIRTWGLHKHWAQRGPHGSSICFAL